MSDHVCAIDAHVFPTHATHLSGYRLRPVTPGGLEGDGAQAKGVITN